MRRITIDVTREAVSLRSPDTYQPLQGQWTSFYLALALQAYLPGHPPPFLEAHDLRLLGPWFHKKPGSVGKEIARHHQDLVELGLDNLILHDGRTKRWRLNVPPEEIELLPSREECETWLREQRWDPVDAVEEFPETLVAWLVHTTRALIRLEEGEIDAGLRLIDEAKREHGDSVLLCAIAELVELRLWARVGKYPEPSPSLSQCPGNIGRALSARATLAQVLAPAIDPSHLESAIEHSKKLLTRLENIPDINGLGIAHNVLGVLLRRRKNFDQAVKSLRYAAALLVASYDLITLQAAVFNLGHTLSELARDEKELREALKLVELDREICVALGLGRDSAQAEIVAGTICLELGELEAAKQWLFAGQCMVETLDSDYNRGGVEELRARILWTRSLHDHQKLEPQAIREIVEAYQKARDLIFVAGFDVSYLDAEIKMVKQEQPPPWRRPGWRRADLDDTASALPG